MSVSKDRRDRNRLTQMTLGEWTEGVDKNKCSRNITKIAGTCYEHRPTDDTLAQNVFTLQSLNNIFLFMNEFNEFSSELSCKLHSLYAFYSLFLNGGQLNNTVIAKRMPTGIIFNKYAFML